MAYSSIWYFTETPQEIVDILCKDVTQFNKDFQESALLNSNVYSGNHMNNEIRSSKHAWIPSHHWIGGFLWHYICLANRSNFLYDIECIDDESIQYTEYTEGDHYTWHADTVIDYQYQPKFHRATQANIAEDKHFLSGESSRKLSFVMQLSDEDDYEGGELQFHDQTKNNYIAPKKKGTIIVFDSRVSHRVRKVRSGIRRSLVGWVVGPRWK